LDHYAFLAGTFTDGIACKKVARISKSLNKRKHRIGKALLTVGS
jgi:hypothetical protein